MPPFTLHSHRDLCQPAVRHRHFLRHRAALRLSLRLVEAVLAAMAGQGGGRSEPDLGAAARQRRPRGRGLAAAATHAEKGRPLVLLALPLAGPTPPTLLRSGGARGGPGGWCGGRAPRDPGALLPGHGLLP